MGNSRKTWVVRNPDGDGWLVGWRSDEGKRKQKVFPNKGQAERYAATKLIEIRSELIPSTDIIPISWEELLAKYRTHMEYDQCKPGAIKRRFLAIHTFAREMESHSPVARYARAAGAVHRRW